MRGPTPTKLGELARLVAAECVTAHLIRVTPLVRTLATELGVQVRRHWRPGAVWLNSYRKCPLAHLIGELRGPAHVAPPCSARSRPPATRFVHLRRPTFTASASASALLLSWACPGVSTAASDTPDAVADQVQLAADPPRL